MKYCSNLTEEVLLVGVKKEELAIIVWEGRYILDSLQVGCRRNTRRQKTIHCKI